MARYQRIERQSNVDVLCARQRSDLDLVVSLSAVNSFQICFGDNVDIVIDIGVLA